MPYIKQRKRDRYEHSIQMLINDLLMFPDGLDGNLNYIISTLLYRIWSDNRSYEKGNKLIGVLECAKLEFYRRILAKYETKKTETNGDIYVPPEENK
jgi:hypothetical protein